MKKQRSGKSSYSSRASYRNSSNGLCLLISICFEILGFPSGWVVTFIQKSLLKVHLKQVTTTVRVSFPEVMVNGQFNGICWHSPSMSSHLGGRCSDFCGIYNLFRFNISIEIERGVTVLGLNFQKFDCDKNFPTQKLPGGR